MIYTVTFNPALDYIMRIGEFQEGEVNRSVSEDVFYGGKGINVSTVLHNLGVDTVALGFIAGFTGDALEQGVRTRGIKTDFIKLESGMTRINVKLKAESETDLNARGPHISEDEVDMLFEKLDSLQSGDTLVLAGSIPHSLPDDVYEKIMVHLQGRGIRFVVDATKDLLGNVLKYKPFLIKPNKRELGEWYGQTLQSEDDVIKAAKSARECGAENVLVSMGNEGAILLTNENSMHKIGVVEGKVKNAVGAGDSMVAGFLAGYQKTGDFAYALKLGAAAGNATAFSDDLATAEQIMKVFDSL